MKEIIELRQEIDLLDSRLLELLSRRFELSKKIIEKKSKLGLSSLDEKREEVILEKARSQGPKLEKLYIELLRISKEK